MVEIDDALYSRQRFVLGEGAMQKITSSKVVLCGLGGVGIEIAKNLVLSGVGELVIQDNELCITSDMATQFYIRQSDVDDRKTRAEASLPHLSALNPYVHITLIKNNLTSIRESLTDEANLEVLRPLWEHSVEGSGKVGCLIVTQCSLHSATLLDLFCRKHDIPFIYTDVYGVLGNIFCDFGPEFLIIDPDGEPPREFFIGHIEKKSASELLVKVYADRRHNLETGHAIQFCELSGMTELNGGQFIVEVVSPSELLVNVDTDILSPYLGGGIGLQIVQSRRKNFESLLEQLRRPSIVTPDLARPDEGKMLHHVFLALMKYCLKNGKLPRPWDDDDWGVFIFNYFQVLQYSPHDLQDVDMYTVLRLVQVSAGQLPPLCAFVGSMAAQEAMKALTGSFTPFDQWFYVQCEAVVPALPFEEPMELKGERYDPLTVCIGPANVERLQNLSAFMVGCGAIGCELLKNLALLGVATSEDKTSLSTDYSSTCDDSSSTVANAVSTTLMEPPQDLNDPSDLQTASSHMTPTDLSADPIELLQSRGGDGDLLSPFEVEFEPSQSGGAHVVGLLATSSTSLHHLTSMSVAATTPTMTSTVLGDHQNGQSRDMPNVVLTSSLSTGGNEAGTPSLSGLLADVESAALTQTVTNTSDSRFSFPVARQPTVESIDDEAAAAAGATGESVGCKLSETRNIPLVPLESPAHSSGFNADVESTSVPVADLHISQNKPATSTIPMAILRTRTKRKSPHNSCLTITDPDHIEKSNLNRQFLFHSEHIGQSKSLIAAQVVRAINPALRIRAMEHKVCPAVEKTQFTDSFLLEATRGPAAPSSPTPDTSTTGVVLAALDCVASRRYLDTRCVSLHLPLFESGTLGTKGHVQIVLPGLTESYNSQRDDDDDGGGGDGAGGNQSSIPYCTLKSFPSLPLHCIEWAREKFASQFTLKPQKLAQLLTSLDRREPGRQLTVLADQLLTPSLQTTSGCTEHLTAAQVPAKAMWLSSQLTRSLAKFLASRPVDWSGCVKVARDKFERYFNHQARQLLCSFPPETKLADGSPFWQLPKRQPTPILFNPANELHQQFIVSHSRILATQLNIPVADKLLSIVNLPSPTNDVLQTHLEICLLGHVPPSFVPSNKRIITDEDETEPTLIDELKEAGPSDGSVAMEDERNGDALSDLDEHLTQALNVAKKACRDGEKLRVIYECHPVHFEKDDDGLAHVDFIAAAANLRAQMYGLRTTPRHEVRRIAGRIVPAIATTTAAVAGLVSLELLKYVCATAPRDALVDSASNRDLLHHSEARNTFLNLALPVVLFSEPAPCIRTRLPNGESFTLWDRWTISAPSDPAWESNYRLCDFIRDIRRRHSLEPTVITQGNRMIYVHYMPTHKSRVNKPFKSLLNILPEDDQYVDLFVAYSPGPDAPPDADYIQGPPIRFVLTSSPDKANNESAIIPTPVEHPRPVLA